MKAKFILTAFIGMLLFAGIATAQHVKVISGETLIIPSPDTPQGGVWKTLTMDIPAGRQNGRLSTYLTYKLARVAPPAASGHQTYGLEFLGGVVVGASRDYPTETISFYYNDIEYQDNIQFFEAVIPETTREGCLESTDFSNAMPIGPDRARMTYDPDTNTNTAILQFAMLDGSVRSQSCRTVLAVGPGGSVDSAAWQATEWRYTPVRR
jgi:hypothetical protein